MDLSRTQALIGTENIRRLAGACVAVCGLGGVGGYAVEALVRSGVGRLILVDNDTVDPSNLNRQIIATVRTVGMPKTEAAAERARQINPEVEITALPLFLSPETVTQVFDERPDFIIDAVDNVTAKLALAAGAKERLIGFVSSMGTGNRLDPTRFTVGSIRDTAGCGCGLARVMRRECAKRGLDIRVVYSTEPPVDPVTPVEGTNGRHPPASAGWVVGAAGLALAGCAVRWIIDDSILEGTKENEAADNS